MSSYLQSTQKKFINPSENKHYLGYNPAKPCLTERTAPYSNPKGNASLTYNSVTPKRAGIQEQGKIGLSNFLSPRSDNYQNIMPNQLNQTYANGTNQSANNGYFVGQNMKQTGYRTVFQEDIPQATNQSYNYQSNNPISHQNFNIYSRSTTNITPNKSSENINIDRSLESSLERTRVTNDKQGDDIKKKKNGNNINATNQEILNKLKQLSKNPNANFTQNAGGAYNNAQTSSQSAASQNLFKQSSLAQTNQTLLTSNIKNSNNNNNNQILNANNNLPSSLNYGKQNINKNFQQQDNQYNLSSQQNNPGVNSINSILSTQNLNNVLNNTNSKRSVTPNGGVMGNHNSNAGNNSNQIQDLFNRTQLSNNLNAHNNNSSAKQHAISPIQQQMNSILQKVATSNATGLGPQLEQQRQSVPILQSQLQQQQQQFFNQSSQTKQNIQAKQQGNINLDRRFTPQYIPQEAFNQINEQLNLKALNLEEQLNLKNAQQNFNPYSSTPNQKIQQQLQQTVQKRPNVNSNTNLLSKLSAPNSNNNTNNNFFKMFNQQQRVSSPNINNANNQNNMMIRTSKQNQDDLDDQTVRLLTGDESLNAIINKLDQSGQYLNLDSNNGYLNQAKGVSSSNQLPHSKNTSSNQVTNLTDNTNNNINNHHIYTNSSSMNSYNESQNELSQENLNQYLINNNNNNTGVNSQNNLSRDNQSSNRQLVNNIQNKQEHEKLMMKLLQEKLGENCSQYLMNQQNNQQQISQKQYHSQGLPNSAQMQQLQLQQQLDLAQFQENETPRKVNKSVPMATTANQGQHYKVSDIMKEQTKKNNSSSNQNRGGLQKQIMEQILQSKIGQSGLSNQQSVLPMTPNQILKQQQQQANMLLESANQIENEIQQIWLQQQQQQQQNQLPDQISNYQISAPINALQQQSQGIPLVDYQVVEDYESNEGNSNNLSSNKLVGYQQEIMNTQLQQPQLNEQEYSSADLNQISNQQQQIPQPFSNNQNAFQNQNNTNSTEPIDFDEFQNYNQSPNVQFGQQQYQIESEEQQQKQGVDQQQQFLQQLQQYQQQQQQFLQKNSNNPLTSALLQNQQQIYQLQQQQQFQQQQQQHLQYMQQQQYFNNPNDIAKLAQQKLLSQQQIYANQLKSQSNSMNQGSAALQTSASQLLQIANQQKQQLQQQLLQNNLMMQQNNIQQQGLSKQNLGQLNNLQIQQFQNQNIQQNVNNNANQGEIILGCTDGTKQLNLNDESISSTSSSKSQNNILNKQQPNLQQVVAQQEVPKIEVEKLKQILSISLQVEECLFELLQNREFDYQAKYLIKYYQLMQDIASLQSLPISKIQMKEIQRSINMQIVLIQIIIYEHIVVIKQLRESVRGTVSMNENLQNILNSFQYVHSSFILILILFEQAVQYLKDQGEKQLEQLDLSGISNVIKERTKKRKMGFLIKNQDKISILKKFNDILQPLIQIVIEGQIELQEENRNSHTLYEDLYQIQENIPNLQIQQILDFSSKLSNENVQFMKDEVSRLQIVQERKSIQKQLELEFQNHQSESDNKSSNQNLNSSSQQQNQAKQSQKQAESQKSKQEKSELNDNSQKQQNQSQNQDEKQQQQQKRQEASQQSDNNQKPQNQQIEEDDLEDLSYKNPNSKSKPDQEENNSSSYQESSIIGTVQPPYLKDSPQKPYTLVIDLDETLVHYQELDDGGQFLVRPYAETFLEEMSEYYEIIIFTAALQDYADFILDIIDSKKSISYKLYRQHTVTYQNSYIKDLSRIGRDLNKIIIIDNLPENFKLQPENGIYIQSWYGESEDRALYDLTPLLKQIVRKKFRTVQSALKQFRDKIETNLKKGMSEPHLNLSLEIFSGDEDDQQR
ncbi:NLI interacting factor-like phosphatase family protein (macronuclear) [Tetrahymena thermophila SB210]|uniref:NLI interacting factor-like phosphatase family protein n=1 Tax=Tetrahymena thermophila (strain SB210) TaxID=312017 RepID=Q22RH8_TETTS|nr:NLI interacting factor-like phosphatase family protein [Tetrahymena thermophila SB210]EAR88144.2 NLI interacting factor-like phosphatase family protein [Tetrahymena thermophila SB210]|eukprot:XP_001008389.2 NLI interacting factor-like phosphatase family protein [Tetrahymena thermophila SB210]